MGADANSCDNCRRSGHCHAVGPLHIPTGLHVARPVPCNCENHNSQKRLCEYPKPSNLIARMSVMNKSPVKGYLGQCAERRDRERRGTATRGGVARMNRIRRSSLSFREIPKFCRSTLKIRPPLHTDSLRSVQQQNLWKILSGRSHSIYVARRASSFGGAPLHGSVE